MPIEFVAGLKAGMIVNAAGEPIAASAAADAFGVITDRDLVPAYDAPRDFVVGTTYNFVVAVRGLTLNKFKLFSLTVLLQSTLPLSLLLRPKV